MVVIYETNGKGFLGWILEYPGSFVRGKTIEAARDKIEGELGEYEAWIGETIIKEKSISESIRSSDLAIEDADSDIILENELVDDNNRYPLDVLFRRMEISAKQVQDIWQGSTDTEIIDGHLNRNTFYGKAYCTIKTQYEHILKVQNYYLSMIAGEIAINDNIVTMRSEMTDKLREKYYSEGNKIYKYENEIWTIRKVIRRTIWHDRIHARAMLRMNKRISGAK